MTLFEASRFAHEMLWHRHINVITESTEPSHSLSLFKENQSWALVMLVAAIQAVIMNKA